MGYLISEIIACLLVAAGIGCLIGYLIKQYLDRQAIEQIETAWSEKLRQANRELDSLRADLKTQTQRTADFERAAEADKARLVSAQNELTAEKDKSAGFTKQLAEKATAIAALEAAAVGFKTKIDEAGKKAADLEAAGVAKDKTNADLQAALDKAKADSAASIKTLTAKVAELEPLTAKLAAANKATADSDARYKALETAKNAELAALKTRVAELEPLQAKVKDWESRYNAMLKEKDASLAKLTANVAALEPLKAKVDAAAKENQNLKATLDQTNAAGVKIHDVLSGRIKDLEAIAAAGLVAHQAATKASASKIQGLEASLKTAASASAEHETIIQSLRARVADIEPLERKLHSAGEEIGKLKLHVTELEPLTAKLKDAQKSLTEEKSHHEKFRLRVSELEPFQNKFHDTEKKLKTETEAFGKMKVHLKEVETALAEEKTHHERLRLRVHELEPFHDKFHDLEKKFKIETEASGKLKVHLKEVETTLAEEKTHHERLRLRVHELEPFHNKFHEIEKQFKAETEASGKLKTHLKEVETALAEEKTHHERLRLRVHELEPFHNQFHDLEKKHKIETEASGKLKLHLKEVETALAEEKTHHERLRLRVHELEPFHNQFHDLEKKYKIETEASGKSKTHLKEVEAALAEEKGHHERLRLRVHELEPFHTQFHDLEKKFKIETEASGKLKTHLTEVETALAEEKKHHERLRLRVHELEPFHDKFHDLEKKLKAETETDGKLRISLKDLEAKLAEEKKSGETWRLRFQELEPLKAKLAEAEKKSADHTKELTAKIHELEPWYAKFNEASTHARTWETRFNQHEKEHVAAVNTRDAEIAKLKKHIAELEALQNKVRQQDQRLTEWDHRYTSTVGEKDGEIGRLRLELGQLKPLREQVEMLNSKYTAVISEKDQEIERLRGQLQVVPTGGGTAAAPAKHRKSEKDNLQVIWGIGPVLEKRLNDYGIHWFKQIAQWTKEDIVKFETHLPEFQNRVERDQWVAGAKEAHLEKYGEQL